MKILIADDHDLYREALTMLVRQYFNDAVITDVSNYPDLVQTAADGNDWSAFIIDLNMPGLDYQVGISTLNQIYPEVPIVVITSSDNPDDTQQALDAGALGYILKSMKNDEIGQALELILRRGVSVHPATPGASSRRQQAALTPRQKDVLQRMCDGASNKRIALDMGLSESTVKIHVRAILSFFNVANRTEAVIRARDISFRD